MFSRISQWRKKYERYLSPGALILGFIVDNFTLNRVDQVFDNLIIGGYLVLAAFLILFINAVRARRITSRFLTWFTPWAPIALQFVFGGLFSGFFIFYSRSASFIASWPFVLILLVLLIGNEFFRNYYRRLNFQITLFFTATFAFAIYILPVLTKTLGAGMFILSGIVSFLVTGLLIYLLFRLDREYVWNTKTGRIISVLTIYILFNVLYFTNILPPLPLALKDSGIYHFVDRNGDGSYTVLVEEAPWYKFWREYNHTFSRVGNAPAYAYSAVFSPTDLNTNIIHEWQYYTDTWNTTDTITLRITGGRDGGSRGYSTKSGITPGAWRVNVKTERGQLLGRLNFEVAASSVKPALTSTTR